MFSLNISRVPQALWKKHNVLLDHGRRRKNSQKQFSHNTRNAHNGHNETAPAQTDSTRNPVPPLTLQSAHIDVDDAYSIMMLNTAYGDPPLIRPVIGRNSNSPAVDPEAMPPLHKIVGDFRPQKHGGILRKNAGKMQRDWSAAFKSFALISGSLFTLFIAWSALSDVKYDEYAIVRETWQIVNEHAPELGLGQAINVNHETAGKRIRKYFAQSCLRKTYIPVWNPDVLHQVFEAVVNGHRIFIGLQATRWKEELPDGAPNAWSYDKLVILRAHDGALFTFNPGTLHFEQLPDDRGRFITSSELIASIEKLSTADKALRLERIAHRRKAEEETYGDYLRNGEKTSLNSSLLWAFIQGGIVLSAAAIIVYFWPVPCAAYLKHGMKPFGNRLKRDLCQPDSLKSHLNGKVIVGTPRLFCRLFLLNGFQRSVGYIQVPVANISQRGTVQAKLVRHGGVWRVEYTRLHIHLHDCTRVIPLHSYTD